MNAGTRFLARSSPIRTLGIALVAAVALLAQTARAQEQPRRASRPEAQRMAISVEFKGGTVADYVRALKDACRPNPVNVVLSEDAATDRLAPISLQQASLAAAMQAIPAASSSGVNAWQIVRLTDALPGEDAAADNKETAPVYQVYRAPGRKDAGPQRVVMEVFSLQRIVGRETDSDAASKRIAAVLTAAETALAMDDHHTVQPEMKLHKESGLLIVRGEQEDVMAVKDVIDRMSDDAKRLAEESEQSAAAARIAELETARAELQVRAAQSRLDAMQAKLADAKQLEAQNMVSHADVMELKAAADQQTAEVEMARLEVEAAKEAARRGMMPAAPSGGKSGKVGGDGADVQGLVQQLRDENAALRAKLQSMDQDMQALERRLIDMKHELDIASKTNSNLKK